MRPTVFINVVNDMTIAREEIFGPVLWVITYETEEDGIRIANGRALAVQRANSADNFGCPLDILDYSRGGLASFFEIRMITRQPLQASAGV